MEEIVDNCRAPEELRQSVSFMAHDIFTPQPVKAADVFFLRWVLHNWSDKYCLRILRALVPSLRRGARIIIQETIMPEPGAVPMWKEKNLR